jgi:hypothetical protein
MGVNPARNCQPIYTALGMPWDAGVKADGTAPQTFLRVVPK